MADDETCHLHHFLPRLVCVLTYGGHWSDLLINYVLLAINVTWCALALQQYDGRGNVAARNKFAVCALAGVGIFQVGLCLIVACSGVSVVWCAAAGWILMDRRRRAAEPSLRDEDGDRSAYGSLRDKELLVVLLDLMFIIYYFFAAAWITTLAHFCALVLGAMLSLISIRLYDDEGGNVDPSLSRVSDQAEDEKSTQESHLLGDRKIEPAMMVEGLGWGTSA